MRKETQEFPGITLSERDITERTVLTTEWVPKLKWAWDTGMGYGRYLAELKEGRIIGTKCHKCHRVLLPARVFCEWCFRSVDEWIYLKDTGTVNTFSVAYTDWLARPIKEPRIPAMIEIDGSGGVGILHVLGGVDPWKVKIGMKVKAVWKANNDRQGAITDIKYWKPLKEG